MSFSVKLWQYFIFFVQTNYLYHSLYGRMAVRSSGHSPTWNLLFYLFRFTDHKSRSRFSAEWFICEEKTRNEYKDIAVRYCLNFSCEVITRVMLVSGRAQKPATIRLSECGSCMVLLSVRQR
jgi:hypothetical protein